MGLDDLRKPSEDKRDVHVLLLARHADVLDRACTEFGVSRGAVLDKLIEEHLVPRYSVKKGAKR